MYQAVLIHQNIEGGRVSGTLIIKNNAVHFESDEINHTFSFHSLRISAGGASNRYVFVSNANEPNISAYTADKKILKNEFLLANPNIKTDINKSKSTLNKTLKGTLIVLSIVALLFMSLYFLKDKMVSGIANQIPVEWEQKAGEKLFNTMSIQYKFIGNDSLKKAFIAQAKPLFAEVEKQNFKIDLYFVKDSSINAFALPGGKVIIHSGLIENAKSWEEVMGVLGHELSHVTCRHHVRGIINNIGFFTILSTFFGDVTALAGTFAEAGGELAMLSNSREFEIEADEKGFEYLQKAKMNPQGMVDFFEIIKKEQKMDTLISKNIDLSFLSTHPDTQARIDLLKQKLATEKTKYSPIKGDFEAFKNKLLK